MSHKTWATSSLVAGLVWMVLAVLPVPFTTPLGIPFAAYAMLVGWLSQGYSRRAGDTTGARRAGWGMGLGCAGFVYLGLVYLVLGSVLAASLASLLKTALQGTTTP